MTDPTLIAYGFNWPVFLATAFCTLLALFVMACIAWHDYRTFEIDYLMLALAALALVPAILVTGGVSALLKAGLTAGLFGGATWIAYRLQPARIGQGDIFLLGFLGFAAGPDEAIPALAALCLFSALTAAAYSIARGKRLFRSMFPAALPAMPAAALALGLRFIGPADWETGPLAPVLYTIGDVLILGAPLLTTFLIGVAVGARRHPKSREYRQ